MSRWFACVTFVICVHDFHDLCTVRNFPRVEVLVKVGIMEFELNTIKKLQSAKNKIFKTSRFKNNTDFNTYTALHDEVCN